MKIWSEMETKIIDFHSHMLPGVDDGSPDLRTSLEMLRQSAEQGTEIQLLTPHYYPWREEVESFLRRRGESWQRLAGVLEGRETPGILVGAEVAFFRRMSEMDLTGLCIGGSSVLLVEMPFESWDDQMLDELASLSLDRGYRVVLAHVERYLGYHGNPEMLDRAAQLPITLQVNAESLLSWRGRGAVLKLLRGGQVRLLGSDAHNLGDRRPNLGPGRAYLRKKLGAETLRLIDETGTELLWEQLTAQQL